MTYELAKQLKDAGFPQYDGFHLTPDGTEVSASNVVITTRMAYVPTLEELIQTTDNGTLILSHVDKSWSAFMKPGYLAKGSTPEEAVSNLWLALNKK